MKRDQQIEARLNDLIQMGDNLLTTKRHDQFGEESYDFQLATQWSTSSRSILKRVFGEDGEHYRMFVQIMEPHLGTTAVDRARGVLRAALDDLAGGYLFDVRQTVEADIFDDLLEQAEYLLSAGYFQPAAVIAGAVLEDGLRKMTQRHDLPLPDKPKLDAMNSDLAKAGVYNKLVQKQITALADLRNKAAHGQWGEFTKGDVESMIPSVRRFMAEHAV